MLADIRTWRPWKFGFMIAFDIDTQQMGARAIQQQIRPLENQVREILEPVKRCKEEREKNSVGVRGLSCEETGSAFFGG